MWDVIMKKIYFLAILFFLSACFSTPYHHEVFRSQIYYGQTLADLYENFGYPQQRKMLANDVSMYIFNQQEIVSERVEKFFYDCKLRVFIQDDHVIDWDWQGNNCQFKEKGPDSELVEESEDGEWVYS